MSDIMLIGVLRMPLPDDPKDLGPMEWLQIKDRMRQAADEIEALTQLRAEVERLTRELACRDALIDDHMRKIMHLENRIEEEACKAEQLEADLKHVQGSDVGMMKLLHEEKLKTQAAERQVETTEKAAVLIEELVSALEEAREQLTYWNGLYDDGDAAIQKIDAALSKAKS